MKATVLAVGRIFGLNDPRSGAVLEMPPDDVASLGAAGDTIELDRPDASPFAVDHDGRACPECGRNCVVAQVQTRDGVVVMLLDPPDADPIERAILVGREFVLRPTWALHAQTCPSWPDEDRDWRTALNSNPSEDPEEP